MIFNFKYRTDSEILSVHYLCTCWAFTPAQLCPVLARLGEYIFIYTPTRATVQGGVLAARLMKRFIRAPCIGQTGNRDTT